ncbi:hypothetical protein GIX45_16935 [Erwinia sp. CPCC 100877]|nr:hypothetical protein [Erwinia sp. CPCC 100877]
MKLGEIRPFLDSLDENFEVRVLIEEYKEDPMRNGKNVEGVSQMLEGLEIRGKAIILKGVRANTLSEKEALKKI